MLGHNPDKTKYWLGIFFGTFDMPVFTEELDKFWDSLSEGERYGYYWAMESSWDWWNRQGAYSVWKTFEKQREW